MYRTFKRPGNLAYGKLLTKVEITDSFPLWSRRERGPPTFQDASALNFETPKGSDTSNRISTLCKSVNSSKKKEEKRKKPLQITLIRNFWFIDEKNFTVCKIVEKNFCIDSKFFKSIKKRIEILSHRLEIFYYEFIKKIRDGILENQWIWNFEIEIWNKCKKRWIERS